MGFLDKLTSLFWDDPEPEVDPNHALVERAKRLIAEILGQQLETLGFAPGTFPDDGLKFDGLTRGYVLGVAGGSTKDWPTELRTTMAFELVREAFEFVFGTRGTAVMVRTVEQNKIGDRDVMAGALAGEEEAVTVQDRTVYHRPRQFYLLNRHMTH